MEQFVSQTHDPVLKIRKDGKLSWSNGAAKPLLHEWGTQIGEKVPLFIENFAKRVISQNTPEKTEIKVKKRVYLISFHPLPGEEVVNVYGLDITGQKKLEEKLRIKEKQHDALHQMGTLALRCENLQDFINNSLKLVAKTLDLEYCGILELQPDGNFLLRAGIGWKPEYVGKTIISGNKDSQAGYTLYSKVAVIVRNFKREERFSASSLLKEHGISSGISVIIGKMEKPYGVLSAHSRRPRRFTAEDTFFLSSVAFLISEVIERRYAEEELRKYKEQLEELVKKRTSELLRANEQLSLEIVGRKLIEKALQNNVYFLETFLNAIPTPVFYRDLNGIYQGCNEIFAREIIGLPREKVIGHSVYEFRGHFSEEVFSTSAAYEKILLNEGKSLPHELKIKCANGKERDFLVHKATYSSVTGEITGIVGVMLDITERKKAEEALLKTEEIRKKEIHHRIKNNLQVISSLLSLQAEHFSDRKVKESFHDSQNRVISMSLIHEELYKTEETGEIETFDFREYLKKLSNELFRSYIIGDKNIHLKLDIENAFFGMDIGIPLGIIINELVSNSLKHAFPEGRDGQIKIKLHRTDKCEDMENSQTLNSCGAAKYLLIVSDNGTGLPQNFNFKSTSSLGLQLVNILVEQIDGSIELGKGQGTEFRIKFREKTD